MSYQYDIGEKGRKISRFLGKVRRELQCALDHEKITRKLSQQQIANLLGVNRSVINRQFLGGGGNLTLRRVAELAWALGWEIVFELRKPHVLHGQNHLIAPPKTYSIDNAPLVLNGVPKTTTDDRIAV
jgi:predicted XRE-type DNA-binding protein